MSLMRREVSRREGYRRRLARARESLFLTFGLLAPSVSLAQPVATSEARDLRNLGGDVWSVWTSPGRFDRDRVLPVTASAGMIANALVADSVIWQLLSTHADARPLRLLAPLRADGVGLIKDLTTSTYLIPLSVATYAAGRLSHSASLRDAGLGCGASYLASLGARLVSYGVVGRPRPYLNESSLELSFPGFRDWDRRSFTAGHAGNAAACASFLSHRFSLGVAEPLLFVYVAAVGLARMTDGAHWASDTVTAVILGVAIGSSIADRSFGRHRATEGQASGSGQFPVLRFKVTF
jgi:membrane-associated phospholipid phosphatase